MKKDEFESLLVTDNFHFTSAFQVLNEMRVNEEMCDVILCTDDSLRVPAHRVVLSACSPYFRAMFNTNFLEAHQSVIHLKDLEGNTLEDIISYFYTGKLRINYDNVEGVIKLAKVFYINNLINKCEIFLRRNMSPKNSLGLEAFALHYSLSNLKDHATRYSCWYFDFIKDEEEFCLLPFQSLKCLIQNDSLKATSEEFVLEAVIKWLFFEYQNRKNYVPELLPFIRFPLMSMQYLENSQTIKLLVDNFSLAQVYINEALQYKNFGISKNLDIGKVCSPRAASEDIYVLGGWSNGQKLKSVQCFNVDTLKWTPVQNMSVAHLTKEDYFRVIVSNDELYTICIGKVMKYDPVDGMWCKVASGPEMPCKWSGICECNGIIYVIGGNNMKESKKFNTDTCQWSTLPEMHQVRFYPGVAVFNGKIYVIGGLDNNWSPQKACECYDPAVDTWIDIARMKTPRWSLGVAVLNKKIYAIGGSHKDEQLSNSVEVYDPQLGYWERSVATLNYGRRCLGVAVVNNSIYVVGGRIANTIECYNHALNEWKVIGSVRACCNFGCVALRII
ncbi:kelch-like protein 3 [Hydra vulgaris]|uniref:kelch-like protein 3 n=1 Tax=Hydra vulgaris TaxID=6087 RepID=UPI001F5E36CB|nr:kelch-like protein 3 [Hydra vulgaris]